MPQQDMKYMYNVTLRPVRIFFLLFLCSCGALLYSHRKLFIRLLWLCHVSFTYFVNGEALA
jgi:hypothetical protein